VATEIQKLDEEPVFGASDQIAKFASTFLADQLDRQYKNAANEFIWQWFFPAQVLTWVPATQEYRRYHVHESVVRKAIKQAVSDAKITKRASHTSAFLCQPFIAGQLRYPHYPGIAGTQRFKNDNDIYPDGAKQNAHGGQKSTGLLEGAFLNDRKKALTWHLSI
jgi:hypothetical protein